MTSISLGVYLIHPLVGRPVRFLGAHVALLVRNQLFLAVPLSVLVMLATVSVVLLMMDSPLRKVLA